jgi:hypothetical protein
VSQSFGYIPKTGIAGSNGRSMFSFLSSLQIFFQSGCTSLHSHQQCKRVPFSPNPRQHLLLVKHHFLKVIRGVPFVPIPSVRLICDSLFCYCCCNAGYQRQVLLHAKRVLLLGYMPSPVIIFSPSWDPCKTLLFVTTCIL